jgi:hypothetical protein
MQDVAGPIVAGRRQAMDGSPCHASYLASCRPFQFSPPWNSVPADSHAYLGPADPTAALAVLAAAYTEPQLIESGLAVRDATGSVVIHPYLACPDVPLLALSKLHDRRVNNLMAPQGCVRPPGVSLFAALRDAWTFKALAKNSRQLLVTGDLIDAILLRSLGLAAAPIAGQETLDSHGIDLLSELCDVLEREDAGREKPLPFEPSDHETSSRHEYGPRSSYRLPGDGLLLGYGAKNSCELSVVGWSVHALDRAEPAATSRALQHLDAAAAMSGRDPMGCDGWVASEKSIDRMTHALQQREPRWAAKQIIESLQTEVGSLLGRRSPPRTPPADLAAASARLHQTYLDPWDDSMARERRRVALAEH